MGDVGDVLLGVFQNPGILIGIPLAFLGAVFMSFGAQYQHRGVTKVERLSGSAAQGLSMQQLGRLLHSHAIRSRKKNDVTDLEIRALRVFELKIHHSTQTRKHAGH